MKKKILLTNIALFLVADILVSGYIIDKAHKRTNQVPTFTPQTTVSVETETPTETEFKIEETVVEETKEPIKTVDQTEVGQIVADTTVTMDNLKKFSEKLNKRFLLFRLMF